MRAVHVGVGHEDYLLVADPGYVELPLPFPYPGAENGDGGSYLLVGEHLVEPGLLHVEDLSLERQDGLVRPVPGLLGGTARRFSLDYVELAFGRVPFLAVGQLSGKGAGFEGAFSPGELLCLSRGVSRPRGVYGLFHYAPCDLGVFLEKRPELLVQQGFHRAPHRGVAELGLGLALELRIGNLHAHHRHEPLPHVLSGERHLEVLQEVLLLGVLVYGPGERSAEPRKMGSPLDVVYVVGVAEDGFPVGVVVLKGHFHGGGIPLAPHVDRLGVKRLSVLVELLYEGDYPALVEKLLLPVRPLVNQGDPKSPV